MKAKTFLFFLMTILCLSGISQTKIPINQLFINDTTFNPFGSTQIFGLQISGSFSFNSDSSLVRILFVDDAYNEFLVYEMYAMISGSRQDSIADVAEETKYLNSLTPNSLRIELIDATFFMDTIEITDQSVPDADSLMIIHLNDIQNEKVQNLNREIQQRGMIWSAGITNISSLSYAKKKALFGDKFNLSGFEYYKYGFFEIPGGRTDYSQSSPYVKVWDWRSRHRANKSTMADGITPNPYYDNDPNGSGWITPPHYQNGCWLNGTFQYYNEEQCNNLGGEYRTSGTCYIWGITNSIEGIANLYFNQHIDRYLSVQDMVSCYIHDIQPGTPQEACIYARDFGFVDNECFPFQAAYPPYYSEKCTTPNDLIKITSYTQLPCAQPADIIKHHLIQGGPLPVNQWNGWGHFQTLVGYNIVKEGDVIDYYKGGTVPPGSPYIGMTYWMTKNSILGSGWPDHTGYIYYLNLPDCLYPIYTPIISQVYDDDDIQCNDYDGDGYYNWGIGQKPATCPTCPDEVDCDDTDPVLGPFDPNSYACTLLCNNFTYSGTPLEINQDEIWIEDMYKNRDVIVKSGKTLTIRSKIGFISEAKLIVEPNAKLVIDGGTLTGTCNSIWQGIEVWGDSYESQYTINGECAQGTLIIKNSLIENANNIALWHPGDYYSSGGIIKATGSTFKNNRRSAEFISYHNFNPVNPNHPQTSNLSYFSGCSFITDNSFLPNGIFYAHISMWDVEGVKINGCSFSNTKDYTSSIDRGYGIYTINAGYKVGSYCSSPAVPCLSGDLIRSSFQGLYAGIYALSSGSPNTVYVTHTDFADNSYGVRLSAVNNATVIQSTFDIGTNTICPNFTGIGLEMNNCTGYVVEQNTFTHTALGNPGDEYLGIRVIGQDDESYVVYNQIYNNTFQGVTVANRAEEANIYQEYQTGLYYTCNENSDNTYDFYVTGIGIAEFQGTHSVPAGNTFSKHTSPLYSDFNNQAQYTVTYRYYNGDAYQQPVNVYNVDTEHTHHENSCPDHFGNDGSAINKLTLEQIDALRQEYYDNSSAYNNKLALFESLEDGGNTSGLAAEIEACTPYDTAELHSELSSISPFLSGEILRALADRSGLFSISTLFEILAANPDELRNEAFLTYLAEKANPLPEYIIDRLRNIAADSTEKTALKSELSYFQAGRFSALYPLIHDVLSDTVTDFSTFRNLMEMQQSLSADYQIIDSWMHEKNDSSTLVLLESIPRTYSLDSAAMVEYNYYNDLKMFQLELVNDSISIFGLDSAKIAFLETIASNSTGIAGDQARNILAFGYGVPVIDCPHYVDAPVKSKAVNPSENMNQTYEPRVSVAPNPSDDFAVFTYKLVAGVDHSILKIVDMKNQLIKVIPISSLEGYITLDTREMPSGVYVYIVGNDKFIKSGKLTVVH